MVWLNAAKTAEEVVKVCDAGRSLPNRRSAGVIFTDEKGNGTLKFPVER